MASKEAAVAKKNQKPAKPAKKKGALMQFFREFWGEVKKLSWPTTKETVSNSLTVFAVIALFAIIIGLLDFAFGFGFKFLAGLGG